MDAFLPGLTQNQGKSGLKNCSVMSYLALFFMITSIVVIALIAWSYTKPGKKWLKEL